MLPESPENLERAVYESRNCLGGGGNKKGGGKVGMSASGRDPFDLVGRRGVKKWERGHELLQGTREEKTNRRDSPVKWRVGNQRDIKKR